MKSMEGKWIRRDQDIKILKNISRNVYINCKLYLYGRAVADKFWVSDCLFPTIEGCIFIDSEVSITGKASYINNFTNNILINCDLKLFNVTNSFLPCKADLLGIFKNKNNLLEGTWINGR